MIKNAGNRQYPAHTASSPKSPANNIHDSQLRSTAIRKTVITINHSFIDQFVILPIAIPSAEQVCNTEGVLQIFIQDLIKW